MIIDYNLISKVNDDVPVIFICFLGFVRIVGFMAFI